MTLFERNLEKYAELVLKIGLNVQKGQTLVVEAPMSTAPLVRIIARKAYEAGVAEIIHEWTDDELTRIKYLHMPDEGLGRYPEWKADGLRQLAENDAAFLFIMAPNPELLADIEPARVSVDSKGRAATRLRFLELTRKNHVSWTIISAPTEGWATKVFPNIPAEQAIEKLWSLIFEATRTIENDPIAAWHAHLDRLKERLDRLNSKRYKRLHYFGPGTDLTVELPDKHQWVAGSNRNAKGTRFVANVPTEEVFTTPKWDGVNGVVRSTMPLNYNSTLIDNFTLKFENGVVVEAKAENGDGMLQQMLAADEGARRLGEIALVPHDSPISNMNVIFYNTGYDENASCHLAVGNGFSFCIDGGTAMSEEQLIREGVNKSLIHVDFMMGSSQLHIDAELQDGTMEPLFRNGNWV